MVGWAGLPFSRAKVVTKGVTRSGEPYALYSPRVRDSLPSGGAGFCGEVPTLGYEIQRPALSAEDGPIIRELENPLPLCPACCWLFSFCAVRFGGGAKMRIYWTPRHPQEIPSKERAGGVSQPDIGASLENLEVTSVWFP